MLRKQRALVRERQLALTFSERFSKSCLADRKWDLHHSAVWRSVQIVIISVDTSRAPRRPEAPSKSFAFYDLRGCCIVQVRRHVQAPFPRTQRTRCAVGNACSILEHLHSSRNVMVSLPTREDVVALWFVCCAPIHGKDLTRLGCLPALGGQRPAMLACQPKAPTPAPRHVSRVKRAVRQHIARPGVKGF